MSSSRTWIERKRDQEQRERNMAHSRNEQVMFPNGKPVPFRQPSNMQDYRATNDGQEDEEKKELEKVFGVWESFHWGKKPSRYENWDDDDAQRQVKGETSQHRVEMQQSVKDSSRQPSNSKTDRHDLSVNGHIEHARNMPSTSSQSRPSSYSALKSAHSNNSRSSNKSFSPKMKQSHFPHPDPAANRRGFSPVHSAGERGNRSSHKESNSKNYGSDHQDSSFSSDRRSKHIDNSRPVRSRGPVTPPSVSQQVVSPLDKSSSQRTPSRHRTPQHQMPPSSSMYPQQPSNLPQSGQNQGDVAKHQNEIRPALTLNIEREKKSGELDDIFKEMEVTTPLTALSETPVKCRNAPQFKFIADSEDEADDVQMKCVSPSPDLGEMKPAISSLPDEMVPINPALSPLPDDFVEMKPVLSSLPDDLVEMKPALSPLPDDLIETKPALSPLPDDLIETKPALSPLPGMDVPDPTEGNQPVKMRESASSLGLDVSDDSDVEVEDKSDEKAEETAKKPDARKDPSNSPSGESSSGSDSSSESESESSSSDSGDEGGEEKTKAAANQAAATNKGLMNRDGTWGLQQFIKSRPPSSQMNTAQTLGETGASKGDSQDSKGKASPRKLSEIGPCNSMPFIVQDDSDPLPRNLEKASVSPDTMSTASSHTSSLDTGRAIKNSGNEHKGNGKVGSVSQISPEQPKSTSAKDKPSESDSPVRITNENVDKCVSLSEQKWCKGRTNSTAGGKRGVKHASSASDPVGQPSAASVTPASSKGSSSDSLHQRRSVIDSEHTDTKTSASAGRKPASARKTKAPSPGNKSEQKKSASSLRTGKVAGKSPSGDLINGAVPDISSIMEDVAVPKMLSPTIPGRIKSIKPDLNGEQLNVPTSTCGKPSIVVRLNKSVLERTPQARMVRGKVKEISSPPKTSGVVSAKESSSSNRTPGQKDTSANELKGKSVVSSSPGTKRKREDDIVHDSKKKKSATPVKPSSEQSPSSEINGVAHPEEIKKAGRKRVAERSGSNSSSQSGHKSASNPKKPRISSQSVQENQTTSDEQKADKTESVLPFNAYSQPHQAQPQVANSNEDRDTEPLAHVQERLESPHFYLQKGKDIKHVADKLADKHRKLILYMKSILYFIMWNYTLELGKGSTPSTASLLKDLVGLHSYVIRIHNNALQESASIDKDKKLWVLILRIQSLLYLKLYNCHKQETLKLKTVIDNEYIKNPTMKMSGHAPSPHQNQWNKNSTGTPSPMSPTPSPACSIGSVESQGSGENHGGRLSNGGVSNGSASSQVNGVVSPRVHSIIQRYVNYSGHLVQSYEQWNQAEEEIQSRKLQDFFKNIDNRCGPLSLHSSLLHLVVYTHAGMKELGFNCS